MSLVFAGITPHPPLLIPSIGKETIKKVEKTKEALEKMEEELYLTSPDTIIIISPHGSYFKDAFTVNQCLEYETDFREFGDLSTRVKFRGEMSLAFKIREAAEKAHMPSTMISEPTIDHGTAVPLIFLTRHLPQINIIPVGFCDLDWKAHTDFGYLLKEQIMESNRRISVIASGDLSHALNNDAPAGFNAAGPEFDKKIQELLAQNNVAGMLQLDPQFVSSAAECGFRSFLILMGILREMSYTYKCHSYEGPFGVGYLTANFVL